MRQKPERYERHGLVPEFSNAATALSRRTLWSPTQRLEPRMVPFILRRALTAINIMDLYTDCSNADQALASYRDTVANGGSILFVGTAVRCSDRIARRRREMRTILHEHVGSGGTLTKLDSCLQKSIQRLEVHRRTVAERMAFWRSAKKGALGMERDQFKLGSIAWWYSVKWGGRPDLIFRHRRQKRSTGRAKRTTGHPRYRWLSDTNCLADRDRTIYPGNDDAALARSPCTAISGRLCRAGRVWLPPSAGCRRRLISVRWRSQPEERQTLDRPVASKLARSERKPYRTTQCPKTQLWISNPRRNAGRRQVVSDAKETGRGCFPCLYATTHYMI